MSLLRLTKTKHVDLALAEYILCKLRYLLHLRLKSKLLLRSNIKLNLRLKSKLHFNSKSLSFPTIYNTFKINIKVHGY